LARGTGGGGSCGKLWQEPIAGCQREGQGKKFFLRKKRGGKLGRKKRKGVSGRRRTY